MVHLENDWDDLLKEEWTKSYYMQLRQQLINEYRNYDIFPSMYDIFNALKKVSYAQTKVLILGQDPYHGEGQAHGFSFSVQPQTRIPPSLNNIFNELNSDIGCQIPNHGCLLQWAEQGVLLLNSVLTVRRNSPNSHKDLGWAFLTDRIVSLLDQRTIPLVFILWGNNARSKKSLITNEKHLIIESPHPSPYSARTGFFGSKPFSRSNDFLQANNISPIDWQIKNV